MPGLDLRLRQLESGEIGTSLIVRALTSFHTTVAVFAISTLISPAGAVLVSARLEHGVGLSFAVAMAAGALGVVYWWP